MVTVGQPAVWEYSCMEFLAVNIYFLQILFTYNGKY